MEEKKITEASVLSLVAKDEITASRGAEILELSLWDFYDLMYENGVALSDATPEEMNEGIKTLHNLLDQNPSKKVRVKK